MRMNEEDDDEGKFKQVLRCKKRSIELGIWETMQMHDKTDRDTDDG